MNYWTVIELGSVLELKKEKFKPNGVEDKFHIGLEHIIKDRAELADSCGIEPIKTVKNSFKNGNLLYGKLRPYLNKVYLAKQSGVCSTDILVFEPKTCIHAIYAKYFMISRSFVNDMSNNTSGVNLPRVSTKYILNYPIPLPPLPEQRAIVAKIEQLFSELDNGIANLKKAQEQLKMFRQAVLKKAFEGELTKSWRAQQTNLPTADELLTQIKEEREKHYQSQLEEWKAAVQEWEKNGKKEKKPTRISKPKYLEDVSMEEVQNYGEIGKDWLWTRMCEVTYKIGDIDHKMPKQVEQGMPYLSTGNLGADGSMDFENAKIISREDFDRLALKIKPERNDIIFPRYGTIGRNILIDTDREFLVSYSCAIVKNMTEVMNPDYIFYFTMSPVTKREIKKYIVETTQANIGIASIEKFVFPLCSLEEQHQIVQEIESRLSVCDKVEESIEENLQKAAALRQSILKKAFEGQLLTKAELETCRQQPDWEPAEKLLERIKNNKN